MMDSTRCYTTLPPDISDSVHALLSDCFGQGEHLRHSDELLCRVLICRNESVIAHGSAYIRQMEIDGKDLKCGIVGGIAVSPKHRGQGLTKQLFATLHNQLEKQQVVFSFLFAYKPEVYFSSGYQILDTPIHFFDNTTREWQTYVYRGGMIANLTSLPLPKSTIRFNGCVY